MSWNAILQNEVCTTVYIECHCCAKRLDLADDRFQARDMTDDAATKQAHKRRWKVGSADGQTLCPRCQRLTDEQAFAVYVARLRGHYPHHELCQIWSQAREKLYEKQKRI